MPQKIKGNIGEAGRVLIFDESDFSTIEVNEVVGAGGAFDIEVPVSGTKLVLARNTSGETIGYGSVSSVYEPILEVPMDATFYVAAGPDDGFWRPGAMYAASTLAYFGNYTGGLLCNTFWNFNNVTIPQGTTINSAYVRMRAGAGQSISVTCNIYAQAADNAVSPTTPEEGDAMNLHSGVWWNPIPTFASGTWYNTRDITGMIQNTINRPGWVSGNKLLVACKYQTGSSGGYRTVSTIEAGYATELHINYQGIPA